MEHLQIAELEVSVVRRPIKNMHLSVFPPAGRVSISVPEDTKADLIRVFLIGKLDWIRKQQTKFAMQEREPVREYVTRESHTVWGRRYLLDVVESPERPRILLEGRNLTMFVAPGTERSGKEAIFDGWLRGLVREAALKLLPILEASMGVRVRGLFVQRMRTKWGSCNHRAGHIRLNSELARHPRSSLEYVLLHEMAHLVQPTHNAGFQRILDECSSGWRDERSALNERPVRHQQW